MSNDDNKHKNPRTLNPNKNNLLSTGNPENPRTLDQLICNLTIQKQIEIDGIGMGVLSNGTAFLTGRGLAGLCGVDSARISEMSIDWEKDSPGKMTRKIKEILGSRGLIVDEPYIEIKQRSGVFHAYGDAVCLAVLEYYAFEAGNGIREHALKNYRLFAAKTLRDFIYTQVGYDPSNSIPIVWRQFHDRVSLTYNSVPSGYFGIFKEIADIIVTLGQAGLPIDSSFIPDLSVGKVWSKHWKDNKLDVKYGDRKQWDHNYPDYFPQARSNPQPAWCYPDLALAEFRRWVRKDYIGSGKLLNYVGTKFEQKELPASFSQLVIKAYNLD